MYLTSLHEPALYAEVNQQQKRSHYGNMALVLMEVWRRLRRLETLQREARCTARGKGSADGTHHETDSGASMDAVGDLRSSPSSYYLAGEMPLITAEEAAARLPSSVPRHSPSSVQPSSSTASSMGNSSTSKGVRMKDTPLSDHVTASVQRSPDVFPCDAHTFCRSDRLLDVIVRCLQKIDLAELEPELHTWLHTNTARALYRLPSLTSQPSPSPSPPQLCSSSREAPVPFVHEFASYLLQWLLARAADLNVTQSITLLHLLTQQNLFFNDALYDTLVDTVVLHIQEVTQIESLTVLLDSMMRSQSDVLSATRLRDFRDGSPNASSSSPSPSAVAGAPSHSRSTPAAAGGGGGGGGSTLSMSMLYDSDREASPSLASITLQFTEDNESNSGTGRTTRALQNSAARATPGAGTDNTSGDSFLLSLILRPRRPSHPLVHEVFFNAVVEQLIRCLLPQRRGYGPSHTSAQIARSAPTEADEKAGGGVDSITATATPTMESGDNRSSPLLRQSTATFFFLMRALARLVFFHPGVTSALIPHLTAYARVHPEQFLGPLQLLGRPENTVGDPALLHLLVRNITHLLERRGQLLRSDTAGKRSQRVSGGGAPLSSLRSALESDGMEEDAEDGGGLFDGLGETARGGREDDEARDQQIDMADLKEAAAPFALPLSPLPSSATRDTASSRDNAAAKFTVSFMDLHTIPVFVRSLCHQYALCRQSLSPATSSAVTRAAVATSELTQAELQSDVRRLFDLLLNDIRHGLPSVSEMARQTPTPIVERLLLLLLEADVVLSDDTSAAAADSSASPQGIHPVLVELTYVWTRHVRTRVLPSRTHRHRSSYSSSSSSPSTTSLTWQRRTWYMTQLLLRRGVLETSTTSPVPSVPVVYAISDAALQCSPTVQQELSALQTKLRAQTEAASRSSQRGVSRSAVSPSSTSPMYHSQKGDVSSVTSSSSVGSDGDDRKEDEAHDVPISFFFVRFSRVIQFVEQNVS